MSVVLMTAGERDAIKQSLLLPEQRFGLPLLPKRMRLASQPWDHVDLDSLLTLKQPFQINRQVGILLRHYWLPATDLVFHRSEVVSVPGIDALEFESIICRSMVKCRADLVMWRDKVTTSLFADECISSLVTPSGNCGDVIYSYNRSLETLSSRKTVSSKPPDVKHCGFACLDRLPFIHPINPVEVGATWERKVGDSVMQYMLESEAKVGETDVVIIKKTGTMVVPSDDASDACLSYDRKGLVVFAVNRSVVLEDRTHDEQLVDFGGTPAGTVTNRVTRLVKSEFKPSD